MTAEKDAKSDEVVCEFFGIEITTKNPRLARILTTDVSELLNTEIVLVDKDRGTPEQDQDQDEYRDRYEDATD